MWILLETWKKILKFASPVKPIFPDWTSLLVISPILSVHDDTLRICDIMRVWQVQSTRPSENHCQKNYKALVVILSGPLMARFEIWKTHPEIIPIGGIIGWVFQQSVCVAPNNLPIRVKISTMGGNQTYGMSHTSDVWPGRGLWLAAQLLLQLLQSWLFQTKTNSGNKVPAYKLESSWTNDAI